ncbi:MAG: histidine phosphatase family protein [Chloroflexi bacterium]|nr:histidine phosphatase family protein [Chloroflexota bacterium]
MPRLVLVRHAAPVIDPSVPSSQWVLSWDGEQAARRLAHSLDAPPAVVCSSPEAKAARTARILADARGLEVRIEPDLREVEGRPWLGSRADYQELVSRYLRGEEVAGWERRAAAQERMVAAVEHLTDAGRDVLVVSHGLVLVLYLSWLLGLDPGILIPMWRAMRFPDLCVVDREGRAVLLPFGEAA